jgi:hypothetical protein
MKSNLTSWLAAVLVTVIAATAQGETYEFQTSSGRVFQQCRVIKVEPDGVSFRHQQGAGKLLFKDMTPTWRDHFGYDPAKAKAHNDKLLQDKQKAREAAQVAGKKAMQQRVEAINRAAEKQAMQALRQISQAVANPDANVRYAISDAIPAYYGSLLQAAQYYNPARRLGQQVHLNPWWTEVDCGARTPMIRTVHGYYSAPVLSGIYGSTHGQISPGIGSGFISPGIGAGIAVPAVGVGVR